MLLNVFAWIVIGIFAGFLVNFLMPAKGKFLAGTISAGIVGAFVGGILYSAFRVGQIAINFDPIATFVSLFGAAVLIYLIRVLIRNEETFLKEDNKNQKLP